MPLVAREGYLFVAISLVAAGIVHFVANWAWALPLWLIALFVIQFFREPQRISPSVAGGVVSPADGKVVSVSRLNNPHTGEPSCRIAIFLDVFSVHSNRAPVAGTITWREYRKGKFVNAALDKSSDENERNIITIQTDDSANVTCVQIAGLIARRILCYVDEGDKVSIGQKYGFIRFGSRVELFLPEGSQVNVGVGDKVKGGSNLVGVLK